MTKQERDERLRQDPGFAYMEAIHRYERAHTIEQELMRLEDELHRLYLDDYTATNCHWVCCGTKNANGRG